VGIPLPMKGMEMRVLLAVDLQAVTVVTPFPFTDFGLRSLI
jgi:hypothetical protein